MSKRDIAIDIVKAIGILLMILGHCPAIPKMPFRHFIFTFHMPLFFIVSGYFFEAKDIKTSLIRDAKHLLIPYFITCAVVVILTLVKSLFMGESKTFYYIVATFIGSGSSHLCRYLADMPIIGAIWFLPALFVCKNAYNLLSKYPVNTRLLYSAIIYVVATLIGRYIIFIPFSFLCGLSAIIFYAIGDYYKMTKCKITWLHWIIGIICWIVSFQFSHVNLVQPRTDLYFIDVIGATTATFLIYTVSKKLTELFKYATVMPWIGRNSMYILCLHLIDQNVGFSGFLTKSLHPISLGLCMVVIPLLCTLFYVKLRDLFFNHAKRA